MSAVQQPRLVIFDFDGTLGVLPADWYALKTRLAEHFRGQNLPPVTSFRNGMQVIKEKLEQELQREAFGIIEGFEHRAVPQFAPNHSALEYLKSARKRGALVAVCSNNMSSTISMSLDRLGMLSDISVIIGMDSVTRVKPDPEGLSKILQTLNVPREEAVFVGDTDYDLEAANAAGVRFIGVDSPEFHSLG